MRTRPEADADAVPLSWDEDFVVMAGNTGKVIQRVTLKLGAEVARVLQIQLTRRFTVFECILLLHDAEGVLIPATAPAGIATLSLVTFFKTLKRLYFAFFTIEWCATVNVCKAALLLLARPTAT